jgi:hypothetical protein
VAVGIGCLLSESPKQEKEHVYNHNYRRGTPLEFNDLHVSSIIPNCQILVDLDISEARVTEDSLSMIAV